MKALVQLRLRNLAERPSHAVIALHGGSLRYESRPGEGTTVTATLPIRPRAA